MTQPERDIGTIIGERIREGREARGLTQQELAKKAGWFDEKSGRNISNYEAPKEKKRGRTPAHEDLLRIARALNCSMDYLYGLDDEMEHKTENVVEQTGLSGTAVTILRNYEYTIDNHILQDFLSDLICSNEHLFKLSGYYKTWLNEVKAQSGHDGIVNITDIINSDADPEEKYNTIITMSRTAQNVPLNIEGLRYSIVRHFEDFLTDIEREIANKSK